MKCSNTVWKWIPPSHNWSYQLQQQWRHSNTLWNLISVSYHFRGILASTELPGMFQELLVSVLTYSSNSLSRLFPYAFLIIDLLNHLCFSFRCMTGRLIQNMPEQSEPAGVGKAFPHYNTITTKRFGWCCWYGMQCLLTTRNVV